jgi:hypothetical protein
VDIHLRVRPTTGEFWARVYGRANLSERSVNQYGVNSFETGGMNEMSEFQFYVQGSYTRGRWDSFQINEDGFAYTSEEVANDR